MNINSFISQADIIVPKAVAEEVKEDVNEIKFVTRLNESEAYRKKWIINATESFGKVRSVVVYILSFLLYYTMEYMYYPIQKIR